MCKGKAQNRIDYIVMQKPAEAAKIVVKYGYEPPKDKQELSDVIKLIVRKKGEAVITDLMRIHPEKELILKVTGHQTEESNYCGCNSSYNEETKEMLDRLSILSVADLTVLYDTAKKEAKEKPDDKALIAKMETIWDELNRRKKQKEKDLQSPFQITQNDWVKIGIGLLAGIILAKII